MKLPLRGVLEEARLVGAMVDVDVALRVGGDAHVLAGVDAGRVLEEVGHRFVRDHRDVGRRGLGLRQNGARDRSKHDRQRANQRDDGERERDNSASLQQPPRTIPSHSRRTDCRNLYEWGGQFKVRSGAQVHRCLGAGCRVLGAGCWDRAKVAQAAMIDSARMEHSAFVPSLIWVAPFACLLLGIAVIPLVAPHFWESNIRKLRRLPGPGRAGARAVLVARSPGARAHRPRLHIVHDSAREPVRDFGRRHDGRRPRSQTLGEYAVSWRRGALRVDRRHDGRVDAPHPASLAHQQRTPLRRPHRGVLYLPGLEHRRIADAARRSAAVPRLSRGRAVYLDASSRADVDHDHGGLAVAIYFVWDTRVHKQEPPERIGARRDAHQAAAHRRQGEPRAARRHRRRDGFSLSAWREIAMVALARCRGYEPPNTSTTRTISRFTRSSKWPSIFRGIFS